jgi:large subunit ribosomal protein L9
MNKSVKLLLTENVDNLGIVGDVVNVRLGYARNFLLPRKLATTPSEELIQQLAAKRAEAQRQLAIVRKQREEVTGKLKGVEVKLVRSCNDQGILYGAITQQDIAAALNEMGYAVKPREVRIGQTIKRIDSYDIHVKLDSDLDAAIRLTVAPDRELKVEEKEEAAAAAASSDDGDDRRERPDRREKRRSALEEAMALALGESKPKAAAAGDEKAEKKKADKGEKKSKK